MCIITIIIVLAMVNTSLLCAWSCMCLMNTLDDCDLEKVVNITNVLEHITVSIKAQRSRSCYAKYVSYNFT